MILCLTQKICTCVIRRQSLFPPVDTIHELYLHAQICARTTRSLNVLLTNFTDTKILVYPMKSLRNKPMNIKCVLYLVTTKYEQS
jgi:hypothetical protein